MSPMNAGSAVEDSNQVLVIFSTNRRGGVRACCPTETGNACEVFAEVQSEREVRAAHITEPFVFKDDSFGVRPGNFTDSCGIERLSERQLLDQERVILLGMLLTN